MYALLLALFSVVPINDVSILEDKFDKVEINHFYDVDGKFVYDQIIWYDWDYEFNQHKVVSWKLVKDSRTDKPENIRGREEWEKRFEKDPDILPFNPIFFGDDPIIPRLDRRTNTYKSIFYHNDFLHKVESKYKSETWTQYDPELVDREFYDKSKRPDLKSIIRKKNNDK